MGVRAVALAYTRQLRSVSCSMYVLRSAMSYVMLRTPGLSVLSSFSYKLQRSARVLPAHISRAPLIFTHARGKAVRVGAVCEGRLRAAAHRREQGRGCQSRDRC